MVNSMEQERYDEVRILLVTDDSASLHAISQIFNHHPEFVVVATVSGCMPAVEQAIYLKPRIILIDLDLKSGSERETISCLRRELQDTAIIALSLSDLPIYWNTAIEAGANEVIHKLSITSDLIPACRRLIKK